MSGRAAEPAHTGAGQPRGELVDAEFVRARVRGLRTTRDELLRAARGRLAPRTLQRVLNTPTRLSLASAEVLAEVLGCGARDVLVPSPFLIDRIGRFGLLPGGAHDPAATHGVTRGEEEQVLRALARRRPVVVLGPPRSGKTWLGRSVASRARRSCSHGTLWVGGSADAQASRALIAECLSLPSGSPGSSGCGEAADGRFARALWSRRRLLVLDDVVEHGFVHALLGGHRDPADLLVLTSRDRAALALQRELGAHLVPLAAIEDERVFAFLARRHHADARLTLRPACRSLRALAASGLRGDGAALRRLRALVRGAPGATDRSWRSLLDAIGGRPDAMQLASDLLASTSFRNLADVAELVATSDEVNAPALRGAGPAARRLLGCLALLDADPIPGAWAAAAAGMQEADLRSACDELRSIVAARGDGGAVALAPHVRSYASRTLSREDRRDATARICAWTVQVSRAVGALEPREAIAAAEAQQAALLSGLSHLAAIADGDHEPRLVDALSPVGHLVPAWRRDGIDELVRKAIDLAHRAGRRPEALRLEHALARWMIAARADFPAAAALLEHAAGGFAAEGRWREAADARAERGVACLAMLRTGEGVAAFRAAAELARRADGPPEFLARHLANCAFAESRTRGGPGGRSGWARALALLDEAREAVAAPAPADEVGAAVRRITGCNRAVVAWVLGRPGRAAALEQALGDALAALPPHDILGAYHLSTATAAGIRLAASMPAQRRALRRGWAALLRARGPAIGPAIRRIGQMAFYLNNLEAEDGGAWHANAGVLATDPDSPHLVSAGGLIAVMFHVGPMREVFDRGYVERAKQFLWEQGGPNTGRAVAELDRLQPPRGAARRGTRRRREAR